jgi:hypothetical protein
VHEPVRHAISTGAQAFLTKVATVTGFSTEPEPGTSPVPSANLSTLQEMMPRILMLSEALPELEPELGSQDLPTVGSAGHYVGACKPCAFFYTRGCGNGTQCSFCHLCPSDEKRTRQKEKQAAFREMRRQRRQVRL